MVQAFNPNTWEAGAEASGSLISKSPRSMKEFQDSQGYTEERKKEGKKERKEGMKE